MPATHRVWLICESAAPFEAQAALFAPTDHMFGQADRCVVALVEYAALSPRSWVPLVRRTGLARALCNLQRNRSRRRSNAELLGSYCAVRINHKLPRLYIDHGRSSGAEDPWG